MKIFYSLNKFLKSPASSRKYVVTIGIFDGVHRAHREILRIMQKKAKARRLKTLLITFSPHPTSVLEKKKKVPMLISLEHRLRLLEEAGIDSAIVLRFTKRLSRMGPSQFVKDVLCKIPAEEIIVGKNFFFGKDKKGSLKELIPQKHHKCSFKLTTLRIFKNYNKPISSTRIRHLILKGELKTASRLLSRDVSVFGTVVRGKKRGRLIGYRTANIDPHHETMPPSGVYAVRVKLDDEVYGGVLNIGIRPTFKKYKRLENDPTVEVHIFHFNKRIYGKDLEISFIEKIRDEKMFKNSNALRRQIARDQRMAKKILR